MGAEESKQRREDEDDQRNTNDSSFSRTTAALAVGAAVGTALLGVAWGVALLGVAWGVSRYRANTTSDHDQKLEHRYGDSDSDSDSDSEPDYKLERGRIPYSFESLQVSNNTIKILTYNVCSCEEYPLTERMNAIIDLVQLHSPDFICFQEITEGIYKIFQSSSWWKDYKCSISQKKANKKKHNCILLCKSKPVNTKKEYHIGTSGMTRVLGVMETKVGNKSLVVATSHLKSARSNPKIPGSEEHQFSQERLAQARDALTFLKEYPNVMFCGDMNWNEETDGEFPLPNGWVDAWTKLKAKKKGYTFDTKSNWMLKRHQPLQRRFDRILCHLKGFRLDGIEIIGKEPIPDVFYQVKNKTLQVLPSDHYGLLLTVCPY